MGTGSLSGPAMAWGRARGSTRWSTAASPGRCRGAGPTGTPRCSSPIMEALARPGRTAPDETGRGARRQRGTPGARGTGTAQGAGSPARSPSRRTRKRPGADAGAKAGASIPPAPPPAPSAPSSSAPLRPTSNGGRRPPATDEPALVHTAGLLIQTILTRPTKETRTRWFGHRGVEGHDGFRLLCSVGLLEQMTSVFYFVSPSFG